MFEIKRVIVGQERMVERMMVSLLARGHCLLEGVPGVAKTLAVETLARTVSGIVLAAAVHARPGAVRHRRHAHLPAGRGALRHRARPDHGQLRARRRDQPRAGQGAVGAARGDGRGPRHASAAQRFDVPQPFLVLATQNPIESEGVYPLPEAQRDRFLMKISVDYPTAAEEREIVYRMGVEPPVANPVISTDELQRLQAGRRPGLRPPRDRRLRRAAGGRHAAPGRARHARRRRRGSPTAPARAPASA